MSAVDIAGLAAIAFTLGVLLHRAVSWSERRYDKHVEDALAHLQPLPDRHTCNGCGQRVTIGPVLEHRCLL